MSHFEIKTLWGSKFRGEKVTDLGGLPEKAGLPAIELGERMAGCALVSLGLAFELGRISGNVVAP